MKKRWIAIIAISALLISLCSCAGANRALYRTNVTPAPTAAPRTHTPAARPAAPRTHNTTPRTHTMPRTQPMPAPAHTSPFAGQDGFRNHNGLNDGYRGGMDGQSGYRSGVAGQDGFRNGSRNGMNDNMGGAFRSGVTGRGGTGTDYRTTPRTTAPRFRAAPPVRSIPRANRIPATRIPIR